MGLQRQSNTVHVGNAASRSKPSNFDVRVCEGGGGESLQILKITVCIQAAAKCFLSTVKALMGHPLPKGSHARKSHKLLLPQAQESNYWALGPVGYVLTSDR